MTATQLALISVGIIVNCLTFALGISVGATFIRKEASKQQEDKAAAWHKYHK